MAWLGSGGDGGTLGKVTGTGGRTGSWAGSGSAAEYSNYQAGVAKSAVNDHLVKSFSMLDAPARVKLLNTFKQTNPDKYNLLVNGATDNLSPKGVSTQGVQVAPANDWGSKAYRFGKDAVSGNVKMAKAAATGYIGLAAGLTTAGDGTAGETNVVRNPKTGKVVYSQGGQTPDVKGTIKQNVEYGALGLAGKYAFGAAKSLEAMKLASQAATRDSVAGARTAAGIHDINSILKANPEAPKGLPAGKPVTAPLQIEAGATAPRNASRVPGGGVIIDPNSPEARVIANRGKSQLAPTEVTGQSQYAIQPKPGKNLNDLFRPGDNPAKTTFETKRTDTIGTAPGKNVNDLHAPAASASDAKVTAAGQRLVDEKPAPAVLTGDHKPLNDLMTRATKFSDSRTVDSALVPKQTKLKTYNAIIEHPEASPQTKAWAISKRDTVLHGDALQTIAEDHAAKTGQPVAAAHETLKNGHGDGAPVYQSVMEDQAKTKSQTVAHDYTPEAERLSQQSASGESKVMIEKIIAEKRDPTSDEMQKLGVTAQDWPGVKRGFEKSAAAKVEGFVQPDRSGEMEKAGKRNVFAAMREAVSPESRSRLSQELGTKLRNAMGHSANMSDVEHLQNKAAEKHFNGLTEEQRIADVSQYERGGKSDLAPKTGYEKQGGYDAFYKKSMEDAHATSAKVLGEDKVGWVENYVRHMFKFGDDASAQKGAAVLKKLAGDKGFTKSRTLDMPLDEALAEMRKQGISVESAVTNREELRQFTVNNARRLEAFHNAYVSSLQDGLISFKHQPGYAEVPRSVIQAIAPRSVGEAHYAAPEVVQMLKNVTSKGLSGNRLYDLARDASATVTQIELSFSAYHAGMTAVTNGVSHLANALHEFGHGDLKGGVQSLAKSIPGVGLTKDLLDGRALRNGLKNGEQWAIDKLSAISQAGGRLALQHDLKSAMTDKMLEAYKRGGTGYVTGTLRLPFVITQQVSRPLMEYAIPRIKDGMMLDRAASIARQYGGLDSTEAKIALAKAQSSIDNRMGELVFDNKFWNKSAQDLGKLAYLSAGYRSGTVGELGGGAADLLRGRVGTERAAFMAALPVYVGTLGAVYGYLHGHPPTEIKDYFYPKNGQKDANGNDIRIQLPSYMRDLKNLVTNPTKEILPNSPTMNTLTSAIGNKDYFGNLIRNPNDPASQQAIQTGQYLLKQFMPISAQNSGKTGTGLGPSAETFLGVTKAPAAESYSPAQKEIYKLERAQGPLTPEDQAKSQLKQKVRTQVQAGQKNTPEMQQLAKDYTPSQFKQFLKGADDPLQTLFDKLPIEAKIKFVNDLKPQDRKQISLDKFIATSALDLGTAGKVKDPHALNVFLKSQGVNVSSSKDAHMNPIVRNYLVSQKGTKTTVTKKVKTNDYGK